MGFKETGAPHAGKVLVIDDDSMFCEVIVSIVQSSGHEAVCVHTLAEGFAATGRDEFDLVVLDVGLPDGDGLEAMPNFLNSKSRPEVIIVTGQGQISGAELAIKSGAWDYIEKPSSLSEMRLPISRALQYRTAKIAKPLASIKREGIIGSSPAIKSCLDLVAQGASGDVNILITGETGTGKELFAWAVHNNSSRAEGNFVVVDCASLHETLAQSSLMGHQKGAYTGATYGQDGLVKQADSGTLFLDEVGELSLSLQKIFLRILQDRSFRPLGSKDPSTSDFRLIAATNRNLDEMIGNGTFREDLLYRLRSLVIELPPLRDRMEDVMDLCIYFMKRICDRKKIGLKAFSEDFLEVLHRYHWPGNVRELFHAVDRAIAVAGLEPVLVPKHLPPNLRLELSKATIAQKEGQMDDEVKTPHPLPKLKDLREAKIQEIENGYLRELMSVTNGDLDAACEISGLSRPRLYALLRKYRVRRPREFDTRPF